MNFIQQTLPDEQHLKAGSTRNYFKVIVEDYGGPKDLEVDVWYDIGDEHQKKQAERLAKQIAEKVEL